MTQYEKYKLGLTSIFIIGFLYCFNNYSENGRYIMPDKNDLKPLIIDTRTGEIYILDHEKKMSLKNFKYSKK